MAVGIDDSVSQEGEAWLEERIVGRCERVESRPCRGPYEKEAALMGRHRNGEVMAGMLLFETPGPYSIDCKEKVRLATGYCRLIPFQKPCWHTKQSKTYSTQTYLEI